MFTSGICFLFWGKKQTVLYRRWFPSHLTKTLSSGTIPQTAAGPSGPLVLVLNAQQGTRLYIKSEKMLSVLQCAGTDCCHNCNSETDSCIPGKAAKKSYNISAHVCVCACMRAGLLVFVRVSMNSIQHDTCCLCELIDWE